MTVLHHQHILLFTVVTLLSLVDNSNGGAVEGMESDGFQTSAECVSKCPREAPKMFSTCDKRKVGSCSCAYESLSFQCYMDCFEGEWAMACAGEGRGDGPSILPVIGPGEGGGGGGGNIVDIVNQIPKCKNCPKTFESGTKCNPDDYPDCVCSNYDNLGTSCFGARCWAPGYWDADCIVTTMGIGGVGPEDPEEEGPSIGRPEPGVGENIVECSNCPASFMPQTKCNVDRYNDCICSAYDNLPEDCFGARCWNGYWDTDCYVFPFEKESFDSEEESITPAEEVFSSNSSKSSKSLKKSSKESKGSEGSQSSKSPKSTKKAKSFKKSSKTG